MGARVAGLAGETPALEGVLRLRPLPRAPESGGLGAAVKPEERFVGWLVGWLVGRWVGGWVGW